MSEQQELNRGYPQADPSADTPPRGVPILAVILVGLGLVAGLLVLGPAVAMMSGS